jgi:4-oxalocrotonate tautomerase
MPIITLQLTREGTGPGIDHVTPEKAAIYKSLSQVLLDVLGKPLDRTRVILQEVELENWGSGGMPVAGFRQRLAREKPE